MKTLAVRIEIARRENCLRQGICPDSGDRLVLDNPYSEAPYGRLSCEMCDCFGYDPKRPLEEQAQ